MSQLSTKSEALSRVATRVEDIVIGPKRLTKYERARIIAARAIQLALGAPPLIDVSKINNKDPVVIAEHELMMGVLPLLLKREKPNKEYQLIPIKLLIEAEKRRYERLKAFAKELFGVEEL